MTRRAFLIIAALVPIGAAAFAPKEVWEAQCVGCHGTDGSGKTKEGKKRFINDFTDPSIQNKFSDTGLLKDLMLGVSDESDHVRMPSFKDKLTLDEAKQMVALIRSYRK